MKRSLIVLLLLITSMSKAESFSCNTEAVKKIKARDTQTLIQFLSAVDAYNTANIELSEKIEKQTKLREIDASIESARKRNSRFIPKNEQLDESLSETRQLITQMENDQNEKEVNALQVRYEELAPCESAYLGE